MGGICARADYTRTGRSLHHVHCRDSCPSCRCTTLTVSFTSLPTASPRSKSSSIVPLLTGSAMHRCQRGVSDAQRGKEGSPGCAAYMPCLHTRSRAQININIVLRRHVHHRRELRNGLAVHLHVDTRKGLIRFKAELRAVCLRASKVSSMSRGCRGMFYACSCRVLPEEEPRGLAKPGNHALLSSPAAHQMHFACKLLLPYSSGRERHQVALRSNCPACRNATKRMGKSISSMLLHNNRQLSCEKVPRDASTQANRGPPLVLGPVDGPGSSFSTYRQVPLQPCSHCVTGTQFALRVPR